MEISNLSITELKALAYDQLVQLERIQANLRIINARIEELQKQEDEKKQPLIQD